MYCEEAIKSINDILRYKSKRISLISSENISSKLLKSTYLLGLGDQYCSRLPQYKDCIDNLTFGNLGPLDNVNQLTREIVKEVFQCEECDVRPISGLNGMTILLASLMEKDDVLFKMHDLHGGHLSTAPLADRMQIKYQSMMLGKDYRLDIDHFYKLCKDEKPNLVFLDSSYVLFPYPLQEIREIVGKDTIIIYDASHFISIIAANKFQNPFSEGVDIIHATTHKSLWGPQKSMILYKEKNELVSKVENYMKDWVSNTHLHHIFALYIAMLEYKHFGQAYGQKLQLNAQYFAKCLDKYGLNVIGKEHGYTESNQLWVNFNTKEEAIAQFKKLEKINVSSNVIFLPHGQWGWRVGLNELTRLGASNDDLDHLAKIISDLVFEKKNIELLEEESLEIKSHLNQVKYSFDDTEEGKKLINYICQNTL